MNVKIIGAWLAAVLFAGTVLAQEYRVNGVYVAPGQDDNWDNAYGGEVSAIFWLNKYFGLSGVFGMQKWGVNEDVNVERYLLSSRGNLQLVDASAYEVSGDAAVLPLGASALVKLPLTDVISFDLEVGLRYLFVDASIDVDTEERLELYENGILVDATKSEIQQYEVEIDDGFVGLLGADCIIKLAENFALTIGGGYQFDILKAEASIDGSSEGIDDVEFNGAFARAGASLTF